jgi:predicted nuclease with TOPRIM domain
LLNVDIARGVYNVKRPNIVTRALRNPLVRAGLYTFNPLGYGRKALNVFDTVENLKDLYNVATNPNIEEELEEMQK